MVRRDSSYSVLRMIWIKHCRSAHRPYPAIYHHLVFRELAYRLTVCLAVIRDTNVLQRYQLADTPTVSWACLAVAFCHLLECIFTAVNFVHQRRRCSSFGDGPIKDRRSSCGRSGMRGLFSSVAVGLRRGFAASGSSLLLELISLCNSCLNDLLLFVVEMLRDVRVQIGLLLLTYYNIISIWCASGELKSNSRRRACLNKP